MNLKYDLNPEQRKAVETTEGPVLVLAGAGSGKTRALTYRTQYLIEKGIPPYNILTLTFTNKAAKDMKRKISELMNDREAVNNLWMGTFHSVCLRILSMNLEKIGYEKNFLIFDTDETLSLINNIIGSFGVDKNLYDKKIVTNIISKAKMKLLKPNQVVENMADDSDSSRKYYEKISEIYAEYEKRMRKNNAFDFNDLIKKTIELFRENPDVLKRYQNQFKYIQIDEYQDTNHSQYILATMIAKPQNNLFVVGDSDQCQPPGTKVLTTKGYKNIEDLNPTDDKIVSYDKKKSMIVGNNNKFGYKFEKTKNEYNGEMYEIKLSNGKKSKSTYNHKWLTKWSIKNKEQYIVFLMKKNNKFRIGTSKLFNKKGTLLLNSRSKIEKADSAWILKIFKNREDARVWKYIISSRYGIPTIMFSNKKGFKKSSVDTIYKELSKDNLYKRALKCLKDYNRNIDYPFWRSDLKYQTTGLKSVLTIQACNIMPEVMKMPIRKKGDIIEWKKIQSINVTNYKGPVYSLNVERHHKYISDEIITCNSIYAFRGANMWNIINFDKDYPSAKVVKLEQNYRSTKNIIEASNALIENNIDRKAKIAWTANKPGLPVVICESYMPENEAEFVAKTALNLAQGNMSYEDMAVLYRSNYQSRQIESALMKYNIPYQVVSGFGFFERKEIKDFISILKTAVNPNNLTSLSRVIGLSANGLGIGTLNKLSEYGATIGLGTYDVMENPTEVKGIGKKKGQAILNFKNNYLDEIERVMEDENLNLVEKTAKIYEISNYESHLKKEPETFENRKENINELFNLIHNYYNKNTERDLQTFLLDLTLLSDQDKVDEDNNKIKLMTVHASKGLEFSAVFVVGMEDGTFPHAMCLETDKEIEEERRLCYVAMTRAESRLFLSYCNVREKFFKPMKMNPSRFLDEIPLQYQKNIRIA